MSKLNELDRMLEFLNAALIHERSHFHFYLQSMFNVRGLYRTSLLPLLEKEMLGELSHIRLFGDKIAAMGGIPGVEIGVYPTDLTDPKDILTHARKMERSVLSFYHEFYPEAETWGNDNRDMSIVLLLEEQIEDSTHDVEEIEKLLRDFA